MYTYLISDLDAMLIQVEEKEDRSHEFEDDETVVLELGTKEPMDTTYRERRSERRNHKWIKKDGSTNIPEFICDDSLESCLTVEHPYTYFKSLLTDEFLDLIVNQSNLYSVQQCVNKPLNLQRNELEQWLGLVLNFSISKMPDTRMHWCRTLSVFMGITPSVMSRDRFEAIKKNFHMVDNTLPNDRNDKMLKVRPMINQLRDKFQQIPKTQALCIDEQLIPFKGKSQLKQYIPSKPHKWGYKFFFFF